MNDQVVRATVDVDGHFTPPMPEIAILLCTYEGQSHLVEQLESFSSQTYPHWRVWASDDQSHDATPAILRSYLSKWDAGRLVMRTGPTKGCTANFLSLVCCDEIRADYYAYSDQDDIWEADKLGRAIAWLKTLPRDKPALYCSRTRLVSANNRDIGFSPLFQKPPGFANALVQNIGGGNTMIFNNAARELLVAAGQEVDVVLHDWWTYIVISGCGGEVFYDRSPALRYRQHDRNLIGSHTGWFASFKAGDRLLQGQWKNWNGKHIKALGTIRAHLTPKNKKILDKFRVARESRLLPRLLGIKRCGLYRQTLWGNLGLITAAIFNKL